MIIIGKNSTDYLQDHDVNLSEMIRWVSLMGILEVFFYTDILKFNTNVFILENIMYYLRGFLQCNGKYGLFFSGYILLLLYLYQKKYLYHSSQQGEQENNRLGSYLPRLFSMGFLIYLVSNILIHGSFAFVAHHKYAILTFTLPAMIGAMILAEERWLGRLLKAFLITGGIAILYIVINYDRLLSGIDVFSRLVINSDTITSGRLLWFGVICGIIYLEKIRNFSFKILMVLFYITPSIIFALMTGSRGPAIAFILTFLLYIIISRYTFSSKSWLMISAVAFMFFGFYILDHTTADIANRFTTGDMIRSSYYRSALGINPSLFGIGLGNFYQYIPIQQFDYIHNIILEAYVELGILGATLLLVWVFLITKRLVNLCSRKNEIVYKFILCGFVFNFFGAMFSGNLLTQKELYFFTILALGVVNEKLDA